MTAQNETRQAVSDSRLLQDQCRGLYYKLFTTLNDDSRVVSKLEASLTDYAGVVIYDCHMFIVQATDACIIKLFTAVIYGFS
jgi:hypothetical protein